MGLSYDIISEFVKVTNGNKEKPKEGIVYATIVQASDGKYVKIDGSDLLTPTDTTTDIEDGERVTVMIKDHRATVTGNVTAPSASGNRVDKVVEVVSDQLGVFETVVADKVSTNELEAYKATIEHLIAGKAEIEDLEATNAEIENLKVKNAEIENAVIDKATIEDLEAVNAVIENLKAKDAEIENLVADKATINDLNAVNADIENLKAKHAHIEDLVADKADIEDLEATNAEIENLKVKDAEIENLVADKATIEDLEATKAEIEVLDADFAEIKTLVSGNLTSDNILSFNITADKVTMEDAFIKDAMIDTVNAAKINAGRINTNSVVIGSEDGGMRISGATQQFTDKNGNVRIQIGRDTSNDFTFALYGEDGQGQIINQNGITASAIADGLIVNDMVSDNAAISGGKLDISSVVTEINNDNTTTIKSNKIYLDEQNQSLEVAFKSLKTQVDTIKDIDSDLTTITDKIQSNTSKIEANKSSISTLLAEDAAIKKQVTDLEGNVVETTNTLTSKYTSLQQNLDGFKTTVNNTYATKTSVNDVKNNLSSNYSTTSAMNSAINQKVDEITASVSSTYATKNEVKTIDDNIKANYSTTEQMSSAISVAKDEINLGISKVYETKTEVSNKIGGAIDKVLIGGRNLIIRNTETKNYYIGADGSLSKVNGYGVSDYIKVDSGESLAFSKKDSATTDDYFRWAWYGSDKTYMNRTPNNSNKFLWTVPSGAAYVRISYPLDCYPKVERGTKHTDWSPAPEDIDNSISNAITESNEYTDSQIKISKDAIELGVSQTYETKSSVSSQISSTLTSAKSYADTKKSEAISTASSDATSKANNALSSAKSYADTKKSEAINSANSTLNTTIANYYTKTQTDSQIKASKDAIELSVKNTYETKTEVSNKINSIQVGGMNLAYDTNKGATGWGWGIQTNNGRTITSETINGVNCVKFVKDATSGSGWNYVNYGRFKRDKITPSTTYVVSFEMKSNLSFNVASVNLMNGDSSNTLLKTITAVQNKVVANSTAWNKIIFKLTTLDTLPTSTAQVVYITGVPYSANATHYIRNLKLEVGNKATQWSPAPEDITADINTAKSDAITSANNTLNTTIANYYTKTQTDSQIKVAKDAITSSVSSTYETKTNVNALKNQINQTKQNIRCNDLGAKINYSEFSTGNAGEIYLHGYDSNNNPTDTNGKIYWNGAALTVVKGMINPNSEFPFNSDVYIFVNKTSASTRVYGCYYNTSTKTWAYRSLIGGTDYSTTWTPDKNHVAIGVFNMSEAEAFNHAYLFETPQSLLQLTVGSDNLASRMNTAEQKITDSAIVSTVTSSTTYKNNLTGKVDKTTIISSINQTAESVKINASKIELTGSVVVNAINGGSTLINGSKIQTGTITANMITSGTFQGTNFIAGGSSNGNGYFQVKDSSNNVKFHASKDGVYATTINFPASISSNGGAIINSGTVYANSTGFIVDGEEMGTLYRTEYSSKVGLTGITTTEQTYDISNGGNVAGTKYTTTVNGYGVIINGSKLRHGGSGSLRIQTSYGYINIGPVNSDWCHFQTDRGKFHFQKAVYVDGEIYAGTGYNKRVYHQGYKPTPADIGAAKALVSANGYQGMTLNDGSTSNWIRTTTNGLLPSASSGSSWPSSSSSLGTSSWRFSKGYVKEMHVNGLTNDLGDIWLTAKAGANTIYAQAKWLCPASSATTYLGSSGYRWHSVWAANGTIQTSDERFKVKQGFTNIDDCFEMIKNTDIYNYIMLNKSKEKLSKNRLGKMAMENSKNDVNIHIGIMAQDIQKYECSKGILIESEYEKEDGTTDTLLGINAYGLATAVMGGLKKEIQIRDEQYECLKRENEELKTRLASIERMLTQTLD